MPTNLTAIEWVKLYTGSTGPHVMWERKKKEAAKIVDVSVFKDGLGPAMDAFAKALHGVNLARRKESGEVTRGEDRRYVYGPKYREYHAATEKARQSLVDKSTRLDRVIADYVKLCDAKKAKPADKLTKPAGPTAAAAQSKVWLALATHLREVQKTIAAIPEIKKMNDKYEPYDPKG